VTEINKQVIEITAELIHEQEGGYTVYCPELDIYTQGEGVEDALANLREAAQLHIEEVGPENLCLRKVERQALTVEVHA
jgi:predicted RNase H-like HicB family nuclease